MNRIKLTAFTVPVFVVVILDQLTKHWIRLSPSWHNTDLIPGWLSINYTQNPGMALGMRWASTEVISTIAIVATVGILGYVLYNRKEANTPYLFCMGLVLGGAIGNIIDRLIMAQLESYGGMLEGHVVDFIHFDLTVSGYPVFPYIFNVADIAISTAIIAMIVFHKRVMPQEDWPQDEKRREQPNSEIELASGDVEEAREE